MCVFLCVCSGLFLISSVIHSLTRSLLSLTHSLTTHTTHLLGAQELGLYPSYVTKLQSISCAQPSLTLKWMCRQHFYTTSLLYRNKQFYFLHQMHSSLLKWLYLPSNLTQSNRVLKWWSEFCMALALLPGALCGYVSTSVLKWRGTPWKPAFGD